MTLDELAERYLRIAEHLSGHDLQRMLDRVEDLLRLRAVETTGGKLIPSGRTAVTAGGADVVYRNGQKETLHRRAEPPEQQVIRAHGTGSIASRGNRWGRRYYADIHIAGVRYHEGFKTQGEAQSYLDNLIATGKRTTGDAIADLMNEACPLDSVDEASPSEAEQPTTLVEHREKRMQGPLPSISETIRQLLREHAPASVSTADLASLVMSRIGRPVSRGTVESLCHQIALREPQYVHVDTALWAYQAERQAELQDGLWAV